MQGEWLGNSSSVSGRFGRSLETGLQQLAQPERQNRLRQILILLCALWAVLALVQLTWSLLPGEPETELPDNARIINPASTDPGAGAVEAVDINQLVSWHLFGEAGTESVVVEQPVVEEASEREGIEKGARESRLDLKLTGVVASSDDGLGHAIIEYKKKQAVYAVDDKLPVSGRVTLAKVMPRQVVLDNGGNYELLTLFDESKIGEAARTPPASAGKKVPQARSDEKIVNPQTTVLARQFRDQLYQDPQSLAEVVNVSAVREGEELLGYRIVPGKQRKQFEQLGFRSGDLVTGINGISLSDPANTLKLYQIMRTATEAVFDLQRGDQQISLSIDLNNG